MNYNESKIFLVNLWKLIHPPSFVGDSAFSLGQSLIANRYILLKQHRFESFYLLQRIHPKRAVAFNINLSTRICTPLCIQSGYRQKRKQDRDCRANFFFFLFFLLFCIHIYQNEKESNTISPRKSI